MRLVVLGGGESGVGTAILGKQKGYDVFVSDFGKIKDNYKEVLISNGIDWEDEKHTEELILNADVVMKSPGIPDKAPIVKKLLEKDIPVISEIEFAIQFTEAKTVGITGSNGKTTTKELLHKVLSKKFKTIATRGNLNNHIGVPLTLLNMNNSTEIGIIEMGANHLKEIEFLCNLAQPDYGYITNFGKAHLEGFGGIQGVIEGKSELYHHLITNNKLIFLIKSINFD